MLFQMQKKKKKPRLFFSLLSSPNCSRHPADQMRMSALFWHGVLFVALHFLTMCLRSLRITDITAMWSHKIHKVSVVLSQYCCELHFNNGHFYYTLQPGRRSEPRKRKRKRKSHGEAWSCSSGTRCHLSVYRYQIFALDDLKVGFNSLLLFDR